MAFRRAATRTAVNDAATAAHGLPSMLSGSGRPLANSLSSISHGSE